MLTEAIVLIGGLGTRLKSVSGDTPKPLVPVAGKPFIYRVLDKLDKAGINHVVLAVGYRYDIVMAEIGEQYNHMSITYSVEQELLGTGGAIAQSLSFCHTDDVLVLNGDTFIDLEIEPFYNDYRRYPGTLSMTLVEVSDISRYGSVKVQDDVVISFDEKGGKGAGYINAGAYLLPRNLALPSGKFSFEKEVLQRSVNDIHAYITQGYFIDIGIPADYHKACEYFAD